MKFVKGMFIGGLVTTGIMMMYLENENKAKRKMIKNLTAVVIKLLVR